MKVKATILVVFLAVACSPVPRRELTPQEKRADLMWVYSKFDANYAPVNYKENRLNKNYENLKKDYLTRAEQTKSNAEFYDLLYTFVSEFQDAHTSGMLNASSLRGRSQVAYLGFTGVRFGNEFVVKSFIPNFGADTSQYPIKIGERISKVDGLPIVEYALKNQKFYRDLGHDDANLAFHMPRIFMRSDISNGIPKEPNATLTVLRNNAEGVEVAVDILVPWIKRDLYDFSRKRDNADVFQVTIGGQVVGKFGILDFNGNVFSILEQTRILRESKKLAGISKTFRFADPIGAITESIDIDSAGNPQRTDIRNSFERLKKERALPGQLIALNDTGAFPAYVSREDILDPATGKATGKFKLIGMIWLDTFSPFEADSVVIKGFKTALLQMQSLGVEDLIIDTLNNGGGSLDLGLELAQALSPKAIDMPQLELRLNDTWLDALEGESLNGANEYVKERARRTFNDMMGRFKSGERLSNRITVQDLFLKEFTPNSDLKKPFKVVVLINEMCASMCDIFAATLKDNNLATLLGSRSMGAGGNVTEHSSAPNSGFVVRQTESLILRPNGKYIENEGVSPDVAVDTTKSPQGYSDVLTKARQHILKN